MKRGRKLRKFVAVSRVVFLAYLAAHGAIVVEAHEAAGALAALPTLLSFGFGDLYWGARWAYDGASPVRAVFALMTASVGFLSWAARGLFERQARRYTIEMIEDFSNEIDGVSGETVEARPAEVAGDGDGAPSL
jgi:hypothetical protein